jgi:hypothetical protein
VSVDAVMTRSGEEEVPICRCPPRVNLASEDKSKTLPELLEGSTAGSLESEGISVMFHIAVSHRGCWVNKELLKTLSLTPTTTIQLTAFANLSVPSTIVTTISIPTILIPTILGFAIPKGQTMTFVGTSRVLPALAAALPEHPGVETLVEMEVMIYKMLVQLIVMAGRIGLGLGWNLFQESEDLGSSKEESSNGEARQEDVDQLMEFENGNNES